MIQTRELSPFYNTKRVTQRFFLEFYTSNLLDTLQELHQRWLAVAGLSLVDERMLRPSRDAETALTVALWLAEHADDEGFDDNLDSP